MSSHPFLSLPPSPDLSQAHDPLHLPSSDEHNITAKQPPDACRAFIFLLASQTSPSQASPSPRLSLHYRPISQPPLRIKDLNRRSRSLLYPHHLRPIHATHSPSPSTIHQKTIPSLTSASPSASLSVCHLHCLSSISQVKGNGQTRFWCRNACMGVGGLVLLRGLLFWGEDKCKNINSDFLWLMDWLAYSVGLKVEG